MCHPGPCTDLPELWHTHHWSWSRKRRHDLLLCSLRQGKRCYRTARSCLRLNYRRLLRCPKRGTMIGTQSWRRRKATSATEHAMLPSCRRPMPDRWQPRIRIPRTTEIKMLADKDAMATIAVRDLAAAKNFYQQKLGFSPTGPEGDGVVTLRSGNSTIVVYESQFAGTNKATSATWGGRHRNGLHRANPLKRQVLLSNIMIRRDSSAKATSTSPEN